MLPARESTAALLLLLVGDTMAVAVYRRDCDWSLLRHLVPAVLTGLAIGAVALGVLGDRTLRVSIGVGVGFTTMVANAAGPVMTLYLVAQGVDKRRFLGTAAWFFLGVNLCKLPFSVGLGLVHRETLVSAALLAPLVLIGSGIGTVVVRRLRQRDFETGLLAASAVSAVALLVR